MCENRTDGTNSRDGFTLGSRPARGSSCYNLSEAIEWRRSFLREGRVRGWAWTPLHYAARWSRNADVVRLLVSRGADINAVNRFGMTPDLVVWMDALDPAPAVETDPDLASWPPAWVLR